MFHELPRRELALGVALLAIPLLDEWPAHPTWIGVALVTAGVIATMRGVMDSTGLNIAA
jgi:uncharacterized membrane protein